MTIHIPEIAFRAGRGEYIRFSGVHPSTKCEDIAERVANTQMKKNINKFFVYSSLFVFQDGRRYRRPLFEIHYVILAFYGLYIYKYILRACNNNNLSQIPTIVKCITMVFLRAIKIRIIYLIIFIHRAVARSNLRVKFLNVYMKMHIPG